MITAHDGVSGQLTIVRSQLQRRGVALDGIPRVAAVIAAVSAVLVSGWVLIGNLNPQEAIVGGAVGLSALTLLVLAFTPTERLGALVGRVKTVTIGSVSFQLHDTYVGLASSSGAGSGEEEPTNAATLFELKIGLGNKLTYLANNIVNADKGSDPMPRYITIGSLYKTDGLIDEGQARIAYDILGMRPAEFQALTVADRQLFLSGASAFVDLLRINVFVALVQKRLHACGWRWSVTAQSDYLRDLLIHSNGAEQAITHHVVPAIARTQTAFVHRRAKAQLESAPLATGETGGRRFIAVPPTYTHKQDDQLLAAAAEGHTADIIWSVTLYALLQWLG